MTVRDNKNKSESGPKENRAPRRGQFTHYFANPERGLDSTKWTKITEGKRFVSDCEVF